MHLGRRDGFMKNVTIDFVSRVYQRNARGERAAFDRLPSLSNEFVDG